MKRAVFSILFLLFLGGDLTAQYTIEVCQSNPDALIETDRNNWAHANLPVVNEGYLHNFEPPVLPCGLENASLISVEITIELETINNSAGCTGLPIFGNVLLNCALTNSSVCPIEQDVLSPGCNFGVGQANSGTYSLVLNTCGVNPSMTDVIGVDLIPATELMESCPTIPNAITNGNISLDYNICITYTYDENAPVECANTISLPCDDNDECTLNDQIIVDECDNTIVCVPCSGELNLTCDETVVLPCNDGDDCTMNDEVTVSVCDNSFVCIPCAGIVEADCNSTISLPCDDGNPCTTNDVEIVSACDNTFVCEPCLGIEAEVCENTIEVPCNDLNDCTENDVELVDACDNSIVCIPCAGTPIQPQLCDDGNCENGMESWDSEICGCVTEPTVLGCTDPSSCNFDLLANCDFECDYSCLDCFGILDGTATVDSCGVCLELDDPLRNTSCFNQIFLANSFTPDGDGLNEYFSLNTKRQFSFFEIRIYNRFGQEVFSSEDPKFRWSGNVNDGTHYGMSEVYVYRIRFSYETAYIEEKTGTVSMIR